MKKFIISLALTLLMLSASIIQAAIKHEGISKPLSPIATPNQQSLYFIPYNSIIVDVRAYTGENTLQFAKCFPYGHIYSFEPDPEVFKELAKNTQSYKNVTPLPYAISYYNGRTKLYDNPDPHQEVPCLTLDSWCEKNHIQKIDCLRLDTGGYEWLILQQSAQALSKVSVLVIRTCNFPTQNDRVSFSMLKPRIEMQGFELLWHVYEEDKEGEAIFVRKYFIDALFR